jgi:hypothetical protein
VFTLEKSGHMRIEGLIRYKTWETISNMYHEPSRTWSEVACRYESEFFLGEKLKCVVRHKSPRQNGGKW